MQKRIQLEVGIRCMTTSLYPAVELFVPKSHNMQDALKNNQSIIIKTKYNDAQDIK